MNPQPSLDLSPAVPSLRFEAEKHEYFLDPEGTEIPGVTRILEEFGLIDFSHVPPATLERARQRGTAVHQALHYLDDGELDGETLDPEIHGYVMAYSAFKNQAQFEPLLVENMGWSPAFRYAGRMDRVGLFHISSESSTDKTSHAVVDFKTGDILPGHRIQLAAYNMLLPEPRKYRRIALKLNQNGTYKVHEFPQRELSADFAVFQAACQLWWWKAGNRGA